MGGLLLFVIGLGLYVSLVRSVRYKRRDAILRKYVGKEMTPLEAQEVIVNIASYDNPAMHETALQFALFRTYAIETIASLLLKTGNFTDPKKMIKRYVDTAQLISEWVYNPLDHTRARLAFARTKWLHDRYGAKISRDDLLYTLGCFMFVPVQMVGALDWRGFEGVEREASFVYWREIGERLGIEDIPGSYGELYVWWKEYENTHSRHNEASDNLATLTMDVITFQVPVILKEPVKKLMICVMDDKLRSSMGIPASPAICHTIFNTIITIRKFVYRNFLLPRASWNPYRTINENPNPKTGRYIPRGEAPEPWYMPETWWGMYGPYSWIQRLRGQPMPSKAFESGGYAIESMGPEAMKNKGVEEVRMNAMNMRRCPMAFT
ncbi:hypothetical protein YB2330_005551 [Saitoella coloradoensis]